METKWVAYVGCYTAAGCADPFEGMGGVPHDRSRVGDGVRMLHVSDQGKIQICHDVKLTVENPSYLCLHPRVRPHTLFVVSETEKGSVYAFGIAESNGEPHKPMGQQPTVGAGGCHLDLIGTEKVWLACSNYGGGSVTLYAMENSGNLQPHVQLIQHGPGSCANAERQMEAHAHSTVSRGSFCFVADLGMDTVITYRISESGDPLSEVHRFAAPPGSGPRSMALHPTQDFLAVSLELTGEILLLQILPSGQLERVAGVSLYPEGWPASERAEVARFNNGLWASDVCWSPCGRFTFAAARLHNSLSVFEVDVAASSLRQVQRLPSGGETPRCLCLAPDGSLLLVAHQHGHSVCSFTVDPASGLLSPADSVSLPQAACIKMYAKRSG